MYHTGLSITPPSVGTLTNNATYPIYDDSNKSVEYDPTSADTDDDNINGVNGGVDNEKYDEYCAPQI